MRTLGVGIDLVDVDRVKKLLERHPERAIRRLLTEDEAEYCLKKALPAQHVAARIAAKEATYKSLQLVPEARGIGWHDMEVTKDASGKPAMRLRGLASDVAARLAVTEVKVSLTHSSLQAGAIVLVSAET